MANYPWLPQIQAMVGKEYGRIYAWDPVNPTMVRHWCEVMGIDNPIYLDSSAARDAGFADVVAPPAMLQAWCEAGLTQGNYPEGSTDESPYSVLHLLEEQGYPSVVAVNSELSFERYLNMGEKLYYTTRFAELSEEKTTALGTGFFVTLIMSYFSTQDGGSEDEKVGELLFRVFKFKPAQTAKPKTQASAAVPTPKRAQPGVSDDSRFFWDGCEQGELRIQRCTSCQKLQHPPAPTCQHCQGLELDHQVVSGNGTLYSHVVMHYPEIPPYDYPNPIGLVELDEGVRLIAGLKHIKPDELEIGMKLQVRFDRFDRDEDGDGALVLPLFAPKA